MKQTLIFIIFLTFISRVFSQNGKIVSEIDALLNDRYKQNEPGIAILVAKNGKIVLRKSLGMANMELNIPMLPTHVFKIASITKPFTALAIFDLVAHDKLKLNDSITKFLPQLNSRYNGVQVKHLLSHTSGIINYGKTDDFNTLLNKSYFNFVNEDISGDSIITILNNYELQSIPGERFSYCNSGYFLLERIAEKISGMAFDEFLKEKIFDPIKMDNSGFYSVTKLIQNRVPGYTDYNDKIVHNPHVFLDGILTRGDVGMLSCVDDLFLWYQAIMNNGYYKQISSKYYNQPFILNDSSESVYSMGFFTIKLKGRKMLNHNGDGNGFCSSLIILPDDDIFVVILGNNDLYSFGSSKYHEITAKRIAALLLNNPFPDYEPITLSEEMLKKLQGVYVTEENVERRVFLEGDKLFIQRNNGNKIQIHPYALNKFYFDGTLTDLSFNENEFDEIVSLSMNFDDGRKIIANKISDDNKK